MQVNNKDLFKNCSRFKKMMAMPKTSHYSKKNNSEKSALRKRKQNKIRTKLSASYFPSAIPDLPTRHDTLTANPW